MSPPTTHSVCSHPTPSRSAQAPSVHCPRSHITGEGDTPSLRQETDGPPAELPEFVSCGQTLPRRGAREELSPAAHTGDKRPRAPHSRSPDSLPDYTRAERLLGGQKGRGCHLVVSQVNYPEASLLDSILAKRCVHTRRTLR